MPVYEIPDESGRHTIQWNSLGSLLHDDRPKDIDIVEFIENNSILNITFDPSGRLHQISFETPVEGEYIAATTITQRQPGLVLDPNKVDAAGGEHMKLLDFGEYNYGKNTRDLLREIGRALSIPEPEMASILRKVRSRDTHRQLGLG